MLKKLPLFLTLFLLIGTLSEARIHILIDEASENKFPVAVPKFLTEKGSAASGNFKKLNALIKKDLKIAGLFRVLDEQYFPHTDKDIDKINFKKWRAIEAGALVKGIVKKIDGKTVIEIKLYDTTEGAMLFGKRYTVNSKNYVDAAHRYVDSLMKALTGFRGPFESQIAASCGKTFKRQIASFQMDSVKRGGLTSRGLNNISPSWSTNGKGIAYTSFSSGFPEIYTSGHRQVTNFSSTTITPAWTPDGKIVVASAKTGDTELYLISSAGKMIRQLTKSPNIDFNPSISPDGRIVFASERSGGLHLFSTGPHGGGATQLTYTGYQNDQPDWSPDGSKIVFAGRDKGVFDIFIMDSDGSNILRLTRGEGNNESPSWSPDSRYIAYSSSRGGLVVMLEDGTNQTDIEKSGGCINVDWGPWQSKESK
jgi:TolB protein